MELATQKKRILVIEDEHALAYMMRIRLEKNGYEVVLAYDGEEGLQKVAAERPDLILLDIILPLVDGWTVCTTLKADPKTKDIFIIVVSAMEKRTLSEKSASVGADDYVLKPIEPKDLLAKIAALIG